jgi:uncharacterized Tic20 family protein
MQDQEQQPNPQPPVNSFGKAYDPDTTSDERSYALFLHLSLLGHIVLSIIAIAVPIIMWASKKDESPFLDDHGREAINFQITLIIYSFLFVILAIPIGFLTCGVGFVVAFFPYVLGLVGMIKAATAANRGEFYRYPMTIRFIQ